MRIYTYGIIDSNVSIVESISGLEGVGVYNLSYRDIGVVASKLINQIKEINRNDVLKHEEVVERLMDNFTVLPVRFFTTFNQEEEVLVMLKEYYQDFKENLRHLRNKVEFGIRVIWPSETIKNRIIEASKRCHADVTITNSSPGGSFVKQKFEKYKIDKEFAEEASRCIIVVDDYFNRIAGEKKLQKLVSEDLLLNAAYLVEKEKQNEFKQAFEELRSAPSDLRYLFSGPWPPYNFINLSKKPYCFKDFEGIDMLKKEMSNRDLGDKESI